MKILSFSYCFPNRGNPNWGIFVRQRLAALGRSHDVQLDVVAPVPVFPILSRFKSKLPPAKDIIEDLTVFYPRFEHCNRGVIRPYTTWRQKSFRDSFRMAFNRS